MTGPLSDKNVHLVKSGESYLRAFERKRNYMVRHLVGNIEVLQLIKVKDNKLKSCNKDRFAILAKYRAGNVALICDDEYYLH